MRLNEVILNIEKTVKYTLQSYSSIICSEILCYEDKNLSFRYSVNWRKWFLTTWGEANREKATRTPKDWFHSKWKRKLPNKKPAFSKVPDHTNTICHTQSYNFRKKSYWTKPQWAFKGDGWRMCYAIMANNRCNRFQLINPSQWQNTFPPKFPSAH